jgi:branched-chain amino acid aminotransferase
MDKCKKIWMNGEMKDWDSARVHILTHALHYGTAVFEGIRCYKTKKGPAVFRLKDHIERLFSGLHIYRMKIPYKKEDLCKAVCELIKENGLSACYIRPIVYVGYNEMGLFPLNNPVDVAIAVWPWGSYLGEEGLRNGIRCKISSWARLDSRILPPQAKCTANYANSVLAKIEALDAGYNEAIQLNLAGLVAEGPGENIFMVKDGCLITPPESSGILFGITARTAIKIAEDLKIPFVKRDILREELFSADELFFTGTAAEITPIREVDGRVVGEGGRGPITKRIQETFFSVVAGEIEKYSDWLTMV